jgi:hypothetical protein
MKLAGPRESGRGVVEGRKRSSKGVEVVELGKPGERAVALTPGIP